MAISKKYIAALSGAAIVVLAWWNYPFFLYSESRIEKRVLEATPLGTSIEEVEEFVAKKGWKLGWVSREHGFPDGGRPRKLVGAMAIRAKGPSYRRIFWTDNTVFWGFDESGSLIDIRVWQTIDSL